MLKRLNGKKLKLEGFNNLTKSLSFNIYDICYARSKESQKDYIAYIDEEYNSKKLNAIVKQVVNIIDANLIHITTQDYEPQGASVTALICEGELPANCVAPSSITGHLDKSHICVHTYPESNLASGISSFRVDIDVSTCGMISPLNALEYLIESFDSDVVLMDYRVRGFTRDSKGNKLFIDHEIASIQDYIPEELLSGYLAYDINIINDNIFHTKMQKKELRLANYLFGDDEASLSKKERQRIRERLRREIQEVFECHNF